MRRKLLRNFAVAFAIASIATHTFGNYTIDFPNPGSSMPNNTSVATYGQTDMGQNVVVLLEINGSEYDRQSVSVPPQDIEWEE